MNRITPVCVVVDVPQVAHLSIRKTGAATALPAVGGTATYTVTVTNTGNIDYMTASPASFTDPLTAVLDDATLNEGSITASTGTAQVTDGTLSWAGPLPAGQTATITHTITHTGSGDHVLTNTACVLADQATPAPTPDPCATVRIPAADVPASGTTLPDGTPRPTPSPSPKPDTPPHP